MVNFITEHIDIWTAAQIQNTNGGRGRGKNSNGQSSHGIRKLRGLIFDLAVRGKLVPQHPNDEPGSVLIEKIAEEKTRLIKEGEIKKQKPFPEISEDEKPFDLPNGWEWVRFQDVSTYIQRGKSPKYADEGKVKVISQKCIQWSGFNLSKARFVDDDSLNAYQPERFLECNDLLWNSTGTGTVGRINILSEVEPNTLVADSHVTVIRPLQVSSDFLRCYVAAPGIQLRIEPEHENSLVSGTTKQVELNTRAVQPLLVPVPPLSEQHRIVAKVDELMALCDQLEQQQTDSSATHQTLLETLLATLTNAADQKESAKTWQRIANHFETMFNTEQSIDQLKQTILQLAVIGKLVPQDPMDLPAPVRASYADGSVRASHADGPVRASHADGPQPGKFFVYALECENKSIYIGQTNDILNRWKEHATGKGADWTKKHPPLRLVHWEEYNSREEAITREKELKTGFGRKWLKRELAAGRTRQAGEPASDLLDKIAKEKARLIKEGKIKKQKPLPGISEDEKIFELPVGWAWSRLDDLALRSEAGWSPKCESAPREGEDWGVLKVSAITWGRYNPNENKALPSSLEPRAEYEVMPGDFLISRANTPELVARAVVVAKDAPARLMMSDKTIRFVFSIEVSVEFVNLANSSPFSRDYYARVAGGTSSSMKNVSRNQIRTLVIALPPILEQLRIVAKVDELMALCNTLKARLNNAQTTQVQLADALVEQAVA